MVDLNRLVPRTPEGGDLPPDERLDGMPRVPRAWAPALGFMATVVAVTLVGLFLFQNQRARMIVERHETLEAVASLKARQVDRWLEERSVDARIFCVRSFLADQVGAWYRQGAPKGALEAAIRMRIEQQWVVLPYEAMIFVDPEGERKLLVGRDIGSDLSRERDEARRTFQRRETWMTAKTVQTDRGEEVRIHVYSPIIETGVRNEVPLGVMILRIDPAIHLLPMVQQWPTPNTTAESLLVAQEGDQVVFLNRVENRRLPRSPLMRMPITTPDLIAAKGIRGEQHILEGLDYRGVPVVATYRRLEMLPWGMVTKLDRSEVTAPIQRLAWTVGILEVFFILCFGGATLFWWRGEKAKVLARLYQDEVDRKALHLHLDYLAKYANDIILLVDRGGRVVQANDRAVEAYGYDISELIGKPIVELRGPVDLPLFTRQLKTVLEEGQHIFETTHLRKDGSTFPVEVSARALGEDRSYIQSIIRDISERRKAEEVLRASEDRYRSLFKGMTEGFALLEILCDGSGEPCDYRLLEANPAFETITGLPRSRVVGKLQSEILPGADPKWAKVFGQVALTGESVHFEDFSKLFKRHFDLYVFRPAPRQFAVLFMDITERKHAEQEHARLLAERQAVITSIDTGLIIYDGQGELVEMNPAAMAIHGFTNLIQVRQRLVKFQDIFEVFSLDGEPLPEMDWPLQRVLRGEAFSNCELRVRRRATGKEWVTSYGGTPVRDRDSRVILAIVTLRDVTEKRKAQEELEEKVRERTVDLDRLNRTLQSIIDCNQAIIHATSEFSLLREFCEISMRTGGFDSVWVGLAGKDEARTVHPVAFIGVDPEQLHEVHISWADDEFGQGPAGTAIRTGQVCLRQLPAEAQPVPPWREEALALHARSCVALPLTARGQVFGALILHSADPDAFGGTQVRVLQELSDDLSLAIMALRIREERDHALRVAEHRAEELRELAARLAHAERRERQRLALIIHDHLQQLLVGAMYRVEMLKAKLRIEEYQPTIEQLLGAIREAIDASRSLTAELSPPVFFDQGLTPGLEWLAGQMKKKHGLEVNVEAQENAEPAEEQVRVLLFEAVRELLLNIVKHASADHARITLETLPSGEIQVEVVDNGVGFDPIEQGAGVTTRDGFGLFSIRERLRHIQGHLEISSQAGEGSRFTMVLPRHRWIERRKEARPSVMPLAKGKGAVPPEKKIRILLVDDHPLLRLGLNRLMQEQDDLAVVGEAKDGQEAVELTRHLRPDVILMDVSMPVMDGIEATRIITREQHLVRIIGLSTHEEAEVAADMRRAGAAAFLTKGCPKEELLATIRDH